MELIRYLQAEELLKTHTVFKALLESLKIELQSSLNKENFESDNDTISTMSLGSKGYDLVPPQKLSSLTSDKTGNIACTYTNRRIKDQESIIEEIKNDIMQIEEVLLKLDIGIKSLNSRRQEVVKKFYIENLTWKEVCKSMNLEKRYLQNERRKGIECLIKVSRITVEQYQSAMNKINAN